MDEIAVAIAGVCEKHDVVIGGSRATFGGDTACSVKLTFHAREADGTVISPDSLAFTKFAHLFGLEPGDLGETFLSQGETFRITGLRTKAKRYPVIATNVQTGRSFKFSTHVVRNGLPRGLTRIA